MNGLIIAVALASLAFVALAFALRTPRVTWTAIGAALLLGLAGYALQGRPALAGSPREARARALGDPAVMVDVRHALAGPGAAADDNFIVTADAFARHGQYADAAGVLLGAVEQQPRNAQAWLALGNALVGHADGTLTPAALYAYRQAASAAPDQPGPPFFLGMALAQSGRFGEARDLWSRTLAAAPTTAPWRPEFADKLRRLDVLIAAQAQAAATASASGQ